MDIINNFFDRIKDDPVIDAVHISLFMALFNLFKHNQAERIPIERRETMNLSKIASPATYFRKLRELEERGFIEYFPSRKRCQTTHVRLKMEV
ncbi:hypothetical protein D3C87_129740 [compost metagenome]